MTPQEFLQQMQENSPYRHDTALLEKRQTHEVFARRVRRLEEECIAVKRAMLEANITPWIRGELRRWWTAHQEAAEAYKALIESPEIAIREAVLGWSRECFEPDITANAEIEPCYRSFQNWTMLHETECCSRERFEELLSQEANLRFRSKEGRLVALGRLKVPA